DKDESPESLAAGIPIVSVSLGDAARFVVGGLTRREPTSPLLLRSRGVVVMGGPSRLRVHGGTRVLSGTAPPGPGPGATTRSVGPVKPDVRDVVATRSPSVVQYVIQMPMSVRLDEETEMLIRRMARNAGRSKSWVVREAVAAYAASTPVARPPFEALAPFVGA